MDGGEPHDAVVVEQQLGVCLGQLLDVNQGFVSAGGVAGEYFPEDGVRGEVGRVGRGAEESALSEEALPFLLREAGGYDEAAGVVCEVGDWGFQRWLA